MVDLFQLAPHSTCVESFTNDKILNWICEVDIFSSIATSQPHATYSCFTHRLIIHWLHVSRTIPGTSSSFQQLEETLLTKFIPTLTGLDPPGAVQHSIFAFPKRFGGLSIVVPDSLSLTEFSVSMYVREPLRLLIFVSKY